MSKFFATSQTAAHQAPLSSTISQSLLKLMFTDHWCYLNVIVCRPFFLLHSVFPSIRVFSSELSLCLRWPMCWSFNVSPSNEYSGFISFRIDWFDLLAVQRTLKSLLRHHNSKASIFRCSAFFIVQLSHLNMTTGKTIALSVWTFVSQVIPCKVFMKLLTLFSVLTWLFKFKLI